MYVPDKVILSNRLVVAEQGKLVFVTVVPPWNALLYPVLSFGTKDLDVWALRLLVQQNITYLELFDTHKVLWNIYVHATSPKKTFITAQSLDCGSPRKSQPHWWC